MKHVPFSIIGSIVDKYHVGADPKVIEADIRSRAAKVQADEQHTRRMVRYALHRHAYNGGTYRRVMGSM